MKSEGISEDFETFEIRVEAIDILGMIF